MKRQQPDPMSKKSMRKRKHEMKEANRGVCLQFMRTGKCERENCKYSHDVQAYLENRTDLLEGECPLYKQYGKCVYGLTCQWYKSHTNEKNEILTNEERMKENPFKEVQNTVTPDFLHSLRTEKFEFLEINEEKEIDKKMIDLSNKLILPSLCTFGNLPFRKTVKRFGCDVTMTEMVMAESIVDGKNSEWALVKRDPSEDIFGVQLCVSNVQLANKAIQVLNKIDCDFFELNAACPIDLVYKKGMGASLVERPKKVKTLIETMRRATDRPVGIKLRIGKEEGTIHSTLVPYLHEYGTGLCSIHGRTRDQRYTKLADWNYIQNCVSACECPVIGIGDIYCYKDFENAMKTGVSSVGIARGALMKPWIFTEIKEKRDWDISSSERLDILKQYCYDGLAHWGSDLQGINTTREFLCHHLTFMSRYVPVHCCVETNQEISIKVRNDQMTMCYKDDMEKLLTSDKVDDYIKITEMFLGPAPKNFIFVPKHKSYAKM